MTNKYEKQLLDQNSVLITGITGMVGSHLADLIYNQTNWKIYGLCRWRSPLDNIQDLLAKENWNDRLSLVYGDLRDEMSIREAICNEGFDYVFHLAAQSYPQTSFTSPIDTLDTNVQGTFRVLEAIRKSKNPNAIIHVCSSSEVFGRVPPENVPIDEQTDFHPASPYAISKVGTDLIGRYFYEAYGMKTLTTRMFTHTGPRRGDVFAESSFAKQIALIEAGLQESKIFVGNLNSLRTWADVRDAVSAYLKMVVRDPIPGEVYNIGGSFSCTIGEMLDYLIAQSTVKNIKIVQDESRMRPIDADLQIPNTNKFCEHTGWEPKISFEETMTDLLNYWRLRVSKGFIFPNR